jgi:hypothetical protein
MENILYTLGNMMDDAVVATAEATVSNIVIPMPPPGGGNNNNNNNQFVPGENYTRIANINFQLMPPNLLPAMLLPPGFTSNVQTTISGNGFTGTIAWTNANGNPPVDGKFTIGGEYLATITLTANRMHYFHQPNLSISILDGIWYDLAGEALVSSNHNRIIFTLTFNAVSRQPAGTFTLQDITGVFDQIHINTHYLGHLVPENFSIRFGYTSVDIASVSSFNHGSGYYILTLSRALFPNGDALYVRIIDGPSNPLPYHEPYALTASIIPQPAIPSLVTAYVSLNDFVNTINFPSPNIDFTVFLSQNRATQSDHDNPRFFFLVGGIPTRYFDHTRQGFYLDDNNTPLGPSYVYILHEIPGQEIPGLIFVGELTVS